MGLRGAYDVHIDGVELRVGIGLVNLLNAYQLDLERGPQRDAAYVYGPMRPRTIMLTLSCTWQ
jgi:outer membrane receptor for ferrienterochelin and colicins